MQTTDFNIQKHKTKDADLLTLGVAVEVIRPNVFAEHDIIVKIDELLRESWNAVDVSFNGRRTERRQVRLILENVLRREKKLQMCTWCASRKHEMLWRGHLMSYNGYTWIIQVQPGRNLPVGYDEDVPHPGGVFLDGSQRITEFLVIFEATGGHVLILFGLKEAIKIIICTLFLMYYKRSKQILTML